MQPIVTITLPLEETKELYRALITRYFVEDALRREQGLEPISLPSLAERVERTLGLSPSQANTEIKSVEDELWQHAWLAFTDEWAWHRAKQEVLSELGIEQAKRFTPEQLDALTEKRYEARLEVYTKEIELPGHEAGATCEWPKTLNPKERNAKKPSRNA